MKPVSALFLAVALSLSAGAAEAACYADYKAKQVGKGPLRLHYGVVKVAEAECPNKGQARQAVERRLAQSGWALLNVLGVFGEDGLEQRRESAGDYFLRF